MIDLFHKNWSDASIVIILNLFHRINTRETWNRFLHLYGSKTHVMEYKINQNNSSAAPSKITEIRTRTASNRPYNEITEGIRAL